MAFLADMYEKLESYTDPRTRSYPLGSFPVPIVIFVSYWMFIKKIGPALMKNRPAYDIKPIIQAYNLLQVALNGFFTPYGYYLLYKRGQYWCSLHETTSEIDRIMVFYTWLYYAVKALDLCDTVFFVLRKKFKSITTLHTYHHSLMLISSYLIFRFRPAGEAWFLGGVNGIVHTFMYFYYFYSLHTNSTNIWWKKHITQLQLTQFVLVFLWYFLKIFFNRDCNYPVIIYIFYSTQALVMLQMFGRYYYYEFINPKPKKIHQDNNKSSNMNRKVA